MASSKKRGVAEGTHSTVPILIGAILTAMPDGFEISGVAVSILLAVGLIPIGLHYLRGRYSP